MCNEIFHSYSTFATTKGRKGEEGAFTKGIVIDVFFSMKKRTSFGFYANFFECIIMCCCSANNTLMSICGGLIECIQIVDGKPTKGGFWFESMLRKKGWNVFNRHLMILKDIPIAFKGHTLNRVPGLLKSPSRFNLRGKFDEEFSEISQIVFRKGWRNLKFTYRSIS